MSPKPFFDDDDDLPEFIKEFMKNFANQFKSIDQNELADVFKRLNEVDPEEIENMLKKMFGEDFIEKMGSIGEGMFGHLGENFDPSKFDPSKFPNMKNFKFDMKNFTFTPDNKQEKNIVIEEAAYFEIVDKTESELEVIVDLPGITDQRQINWEVIEGDLKLDANATDLKYHALIPLPENVKVQKHQTYLKNSIFIIPLRRE